MQTNGNLTIIPLKRHVSGKALKPLSLPHMFKATATWGKILRGMYFSAPTSPYHNYNLLLRLLKLVREMLKPEHERKTLRRVYHSAARKPYYN